MCFGVSLSRWTSDRLEKQSFGEFAKKEEEGKLLGILLEKETLKVLLETYYTKNS